MKLKKYIKILNEELEETDGDVNMYLNPQEDELSELPDYMRGWIDRTGNLKVWDDPDLFHIDACLRFDIDGRWYDNNQKFILDDDVILYYMPIVVVRKGMIYFVRFADDWSSSFNKIEKSNKLKMIKIHNNLISKSISKNPRLDFKSLINDLRKFYK